MKRISIGQAVLLATMVIACAGCAQSQLLGDPQAIDAGGGDDAGYQVTGTAGTGGPTGTGGSPISGLAGSAGTSSGTGIGGSMGGQAGTTASGGVSGGSGTFGSGGSGGTFGTGGAAGTLGAGGRGGVGGTFGLGGRGGSGATGSAGTTGTGGRAGGGGGSSAGGAGGAGGATPTFTQVYTTILNVYCAGSNCHNPGSQKGVSFASQSSAYSAVKSRVTAGNGAGSSFYNTVNSGSMPPGQKLSAANIALIKAWIDAGALNN